MAEVVELKVKSIELEPNAKLVEQVELVLDQCRKGEVTGVIVVTNARAGWTGTMRWGEMSYAMVGRLNEMIRDTLRGLDS